MHTYEGGNGNRTPNVLRTDKQSPQHCTHPIVLPAPNLPKLREFIPPSLMLLRHFNVFYQNSRDVMVCAIVINLYVCVFISNQY